MAEGHSTPREHLARLDPRRWTLAVRVVALTVVLTALAVTVVGGYLSTVIADGLYDQRRTRIIDDAAATRGELNALLEQSAGASSAQRQDSLTAFVQELRTSPDTGGRGAAIIPAGDTVGVGAVSSDRQMLDLIDEEFMASVDSSPDLLTTRSMTVTDETGTQWPALMTGTRVSAAGVGSYDIYLVYSLEVEQRSLRLVQGVMLGGGAVLLALVVGIAVAVARMVTEPLEEAAVAAERMSRGDLTSRMRVRGTDELGRVGASFNEMAASLQQKVEDLTELSRVQHRFVSDVSHELRTPLTTIRMASSVLQDRSEDLDSDLQRTVELLSAQVDRFDLLLADLLEISRFDAGAAQLDASRLPLDEVVEGTVQALAPVAQAREVEVHVHPAGEDVSVVLDPRRIDRILRNLLTNAYEHGGGGPVRVDAASDGEHAVAVTVQDWGRGLSPEAARHVFDRFWRGDPSRARTLGGTGLGLSIAVEDARLHGGWLQAWGQEGQGAVFRLTLPLRPGAELRSSPLPLERDLRRGPDEPIRALHNATEEPAPITAATLPALTTSEEG